MKLHADEVHTDADLVRRMVAAQFPHWAELPIEPVRSAGTDNTIYRLGNDLALRPPRRGPNTEQLDKERRWLPRLARSCRLPSRSRSPSGIEVDEATWARARGLALSQALGALAYYTLETNPVLFLEAQRWLADVLADRAPTGR